MLHLIIGLLGLGGAGGLVAWLVGPATLLGLARRIPRWAWIAVAVAALLAVGFVIHQHKAHSAIAAAVKAAVAARDADWQRRLDDEHAAALAWKGQAEAKATSIAQIQRKLNDEENRRIAADADALRLRGPGKAACRGSGDAAALSAGAGGHDAPGRPGPDGMADMRGQQWPPLVGLPFSAAVDFIQLCSANRAEVLTWRAADAQQRGAWEAARAHPPKPTKGTKGTHPRNIAGGQ